MTALELSLDRMHYEESLLEFMRAAWSQVEPSRPLSDNWHIRALCQVLEEVTQGKHQRVIVNIPPGTLKSLIVSVFWPAWMWAKNPKARVLAASYGQHLSTRDNLRVRQLVESAWFQKHWAIRLDEDQNTKTRFNTDKRGWRVATSVGGPGTGEHPHFIIIDDPHTALQAASTAEREVALQWFDQTISSRGATSGVRIVLVMQRLHQEDLAGHLIGKGGWHLVRFPMRYEKCKCPTAPACSPNADDRCVLHKADPEWTPDPRDPRTDEGELLCSHIIGEAAVRQLEIDLGPYGAAGQLQQRPAPEGGGLFKREWFKVVDAAPKLFRVIRAWDTAATENGGDWTCGVKLCEEYEYRTNPQRPQDKPVLTATGRFFVMDVVRGQWGPDEVDRTIKATAQQDGITVPVREEKEGGSAGKTVITARAKTLVGYDYAGVPVSGSKIVKAKPFRAQCEAGNVFLVRAPWNEAYIQELCAFPTGKHDDQVDASAVAFNAVLTEPAPRKHRLTW